LVCVALLTAVRGMVWLAVVRTSPVCARCPPAGAAFYGNEAVVGAGLADFVAAGRRDELFVTSKVWNTHHKPADAR
jgi:hypothetical protein